MTPITEQRFTDHGDGTVIDTTTGLMWPKAPHEFAGNESPQSWAPARDWCSALNYAGYTDWRLPAVRELQSLVDYNRYRPALPSGHPFDGIQLSDYWSSSTLAATSDYAWYVHFLNGYVLHHYKTGDKYVWPVRTKQQGDR